METLTDIPFEFEAERLLHRAHVRCGSDDERDFRQLLDRARRVARPKAGYREAFIDAKGEDRVTIDGITFTSVILRRNLDPVERVFPFVATCGRELDEVAPAGSDLVKAFWWDLIKAEILAAAMKRLAEHLDRRFLLPRAATMHPGSGDADVWPIEQQKELFALLGNVREEIGVELTDSCLMVPNKTVSGIRFATAKDFHSCQVCRRQECPGRSAAFDESLWALMRHE